jgi:divalent metal cation (Fe/Co/Zn/Cd) transporter
MWWKRFTRLSTQADYVINAHGLEVHEYGPGRVVASIDVEVPDSVNIVDAHTSIDQLEKQIKLRNGNRPDGAYRSRFNR